MRKNQLFAPTGLCIGNRLAIILSEAMLLLELSGAVLQPRINRLLFLI